MSRSPKKKKKHCHHRHRLSACNASMLLQGGGPTPKRSTSSCKDSTSKKKKKKSQSSQDKHLSPGVNKYWWKGGAAGQPPRAGTLERANVQESQAWLSLRSLRVAPCVYINRTYYARRVSGAATCARAQATLSIEVEKSDMTFLQH